MSYSILPGLSGISGMCPGGASFSPLSISGLALWLTSDYGLYQERTGASASTPADEDGDPVGTWAYRTSSSDGFLTAASDARRPVLKLSQLSGYSSIRTDGTDDTLTGTRAVGGTGDVPHTVFVVAKLISGTFAGFAYYSGQQNHLANAPVGVSNGALWLYGWGNNNQEGVEVIGTSSFRILSKTYTSGTEKGYVDGSLDIDVSRTRSSMTTTIGIGNMDESQTNAMANADIVEVIMYDSALSDPNRTLVENYLNNKYGIY